MENNQKRPHSAVTNQIRVRAIIVAAVFVVLGFGTIAVNMFNIQILQYEKYKVEASNIQLRDTEISAKRGTIYDSKMKVLAQSATVWTVFVSPAESVESQHQLIADSLGGILEVDPEKILTKLKKTNSYYEVIKYKIDKPVADQVRTFCDDNGIAGVNLVEDFKRYYPYGNFAATVLGFCGTDNQGLAGLESYYNEELTGTKGRVISAENGWGFDMGTEYEVINQAQDGYGLVTTIDETIQHYLEKRLALAAQEHNVEERAVGIVMDVKTGAVLGMAVKPDFDPNDPYTLTDTELAATIAAITDDAQRSKELSSARQAQWRNKAVNDLYEPGSVFKIVTASSALDSGACTLNSTFNCRGSVQVENRVMKCANSGGHGHETFSQALINSCNPAFIAIGAAMGKDVFYDYFYSYGLSEKTGIDLPGEQNSIHYTDKTFDNVSLASCSFGQSNKITPIQMITAVAAAVNGGQLVSPHVVSQLLGPDGTAKDIAPPIRRQVISQEVSNTICKILQENVVNGNGGSAYVAGYRVGAKSGTSQKLDTEREDDYIASFVG
ncbi:MAG: penicillin-binding transpeptidase domain-containing protein, partial [Oscillospiraceae bacterium]